MNDDAAIIKHHHTFYCGSGTVCIPRTARVLLYLASDSSGRKRHMSEGRKVFWHEEEGQGMFVICFVVTRPTRYYRMDSFHQSCPKSSRLAYELFLADEEFQHDE